MGDLTETYLDAVEETEGPRKPRVRTSILIRAISHLRESIPPVRYTCPDTSGDSPEGWLNKMAAYELMRRNPTPQNRY